MHTNVCMCIDPLIKPVMFASPYHCSQYIASLTECEFVV